MPRGWFHYIGQNSGRTLAASYFFTGRHRDSFECSGSGEVHAIYAVYSNPAVVGTTHPTAPLTAGILSYINLATAFSVDLPQTGDVYLYVGEPF